MSAKLIMKQKIVELAFKIKKPKYKYKYYEECFGYHLSEYLLETRILMFKFIEIFNYGVYQYDIELGWK